MPPKIRDLERQLASAGFECSRAKGSHRKWRHRDGAVLILSGRGGDDAKPYQEKLVEEKIAQVGRGEG